MARSISLVGSLLQQEPPSFSRNSKPEWAGRRIQYTLLHLPQLDLQHFFKFFTLQLVKHQKNCKICAHDRREEIECEFVNWTSAAAIAKAFALKDRATVYRHAHATGLFGKRQRNLRSALEKIIERVGEVEVSASAVVAAVQAYAKINAQGEWVEPVERVSLSDLFERMSREELAAYAKDGILPFWFRKAVTATQVEGQETKTHDVRWQGEDNRKKTA